MFVLNPQSGIPIYRQLYDQVCRLAASGRLEAGAEMPSVRELARAHAVNPMTISKAYGLLEADGVLERHRGKPMTVAAETGETARAAGRLRQVDAQVAELTLAARQLQLKRDEVVALLDRHWENDDD